MILFFRRKNFKKTKISNINVSKTIKLKKILEFIIDTIMRGNRKNQKKI